MSTQSPLALLLNHNPAEAQAEYSQAVEALSATLAAMRTGVASALPAVSAMLDQDQREVVEATDPVLRVLAPAGSGKTHCIANRVLYLLRKGVPAERILVVTFDNASRGELSDRLLTLLEGKQRFVARTLNSLGNALLLRHVWQGERRHVLTPAAQHKYMQQAVRELLAKYPVLQTILPAQLKSTVYLQLASYLKNACYSPRTPWGSDGLQVFVAALQPIVRAFASPIFENVQNDPHRLAILLTSLHEIFVLYDEQKERAGGIDFDDQKLIIWEVLESDPAVLSMVQNAYDHVIVDEFQDLNELDFRLITLIAGSAQLTVVGDDDQAIYAFRGSSPKYILHLAESLDRPVRTMVLRANYRSPANLVKYATTLIRHNTQRLEKNPLPARTDIECDIRVLRVPTPSAEAAGIAKFVKQLVGSGKRSWREIAVLYRVNAQSLPLQLEFIAREVPFYCREQENVLIQPYVGRLLAILRAAVAMRAGEAPAWMDMASLAISYVPWVKAREREGVERFMERNRPVSPEVFVSRDFKRVLPKADHDGLNAATEALTQVETALDAILVIAKQFKGLGGIVASLEEILDGEAPLGAIGEIASRYPTVAEFVAAFSEAVSNARRISTTEVDRDAVRLMTYFRAKGMQFDTVFLPSLNQDLVPHGLSPIEDERRLFYVGVTRAKSDLIMSYAEQAFNRRLRPSSFLVELGLPPDIYSPPR